MFKKILFGVVLSLFLISPSFAANKYAVASGDWSATSTWSDSDGGAGGAAVPADGDAVFISAGVNVLMDTDLSSYTGLFTVTIRGGATPGMLYCKDGDSGYLKIRTGYNLVGTTDTNKGRLLANSDGTWATNTGMAYANKFIIDLQGTSIVNAQHLDIKLVGTEPTNKYVEVYKTVYTCTTQATDINASTDVITFTGAPPSEGTAVRVKSSGTLPTPLSSDYIYYTRTISGNTCKLALQNSDATIVDITATGSGTLTMYDGHTDTGTATVNVIQNVTADNWSTTANHNYAVLADIAPADYDIQGLTISTINAGTIVLSANVDSALYPCARLSLSSRNVSIQGHGTTSSQAIVSYADATTASGIFACEIRNAAWAGSSTFYGYGINSGTSHTISGTVTGNNYGINSGTSHTISGTVTGNNYGIYEGTNHTISGTVTGNNYGIYEGTNHTISGTVTGNNYGIREGTNHTISGTVTGNNYGIYYGTNHTISGTVTGNNYGIYYGTNHTISGTVTGNSSDFRFGYYNKYKCRNVDMGTAPVFYGRNLTDGTILEVRCEHFLQVLNAHKSFYNFGDVIKTACDGTGDAPSVDPDAGNGYAVEISNLQSNNGLYGDGVPAFDYDDMMIWCEADVEKTFTFKVQSTLETANMAAGELVLSATYLNGTGGARSIVTNDDTAITIRSGDTDWSQTIAVTCTPAEAGFVKFRMVMYGYEADDEIYIWPVPTIS